MVPLAEHLAEHLAEPVNMVPLAEHLAGFGSAGVCLGLGVYQLARAWRANRGKV